MTSGRPRRAVSAGDAEGAGQGELAAAAEGEAVDAGDDGLAAGLDLAEDVLAAVGDGSAGGGVGVGELADVGAGGEGAFAGAGEQDDADGGVGGERLEGAARARRTSAALSALRTSGRLSVTVAMASSRCRAGECRRFGEVWHSVRRVAAVCLGGSRERSA